MVAFMRVRSVGKGIHINDNLAQWPTSKPFVMNAKMIRYGNRVLLRILNFIIKGLNTFVVSEILKYI